MDPMTCPADAVGCSDTTTVVGGADPLTWVLIGLVALTIIVIVVRRLRSRR